MAETMEEAMVVVGERDVPDPVDQAGRAGLEVAADQERQIDEDINCRR
ncbi:MAG: hypothetical protein AAF468_11985 [Pseudomonadota bacterium]